MSAPGDNKVGVMQMVVAVIDAKGVRSGRVEPNIEVLTEEGFLVKDLNKCLLSQEQAGELSTVSGEGYDFLSGPVVALLLQRENAYARFEDIRGDLDDIYAGTVSWHTLRDSKVFFPTEERLERTLVLVKPEYTQEDYTRVLETIEENDFVLVGKLARILSNEVATEMFNGQEEIVTHVTSDVSVALVIEKIGAVDQWQLLMGPEDPSVARAIAPHSLRATLETSSVVKNVVYGSESVEKARRDIAALFPAPLAMDRTLAIIKPDVIMNGHLGAVMQEINKNEFTILASEELYLSQERVGQFLAEQKDRPSMAAVARNMSSGPCVAMVLGKPGAIQAWKKLVGPLDADVARQTRPGSLVARFGLDSVCNGFHASDNPEKSKEEIDFFFPQISSEKLPSSMQEVSDLLNKKPAPRPHVDQSQSLNDVLVEGLTQLCRVKPTGLDAVAWLADWLARNNPNKPKVSQPVEDQASVSVLEAIAAREGQAVNVLWAVGGPGSGREEYVASIASSYGYEVLDSAALLAQSEGSGTEYGELLRECKASGKPVPTHVPVNLIKQALSNSRGSTRFIINGFPNSMDEAFHFEKVVGAASKIVYFDCSDATRLQRIGDEGVEQLKVFKASVHPVIEHYLLYSKVGKVSTDGTDAQIKSRIKKHVK